MDPIITTAVGTALGTALELALARAEAYFSAASAVKSENIEACVEYLGAAQSLCTGLEEEVDEILIEARKVARFYWDNSNIAALDERIDRYLNRDRLRPLLGQAIEGIASCHRFAERDSEGFFQHKEKADTAAEVQRLLGDLSDYLNSLKGIMTLDRGNYAGPSGINMEELQEIQELLVSQPESADDQQLRAKLAKVAEEAQSRRRRHGLPIAAECTRIIRELTVVFRLQRRGGG